MFATFKTYYPFRGIIYADDGLKPILVIWCADKESLKISNVVPRGIIFAGRDMGLT